MRRVVVLALVAGCAAPRTSSRQVDPEPASPTPSGPSRIDDSTFRRPIALARPDVPRLTALMPDPERELRWPLSVSMHPGLEPAFAIGPALAEPTIAWTELCGRGAQNRYGGDKLRDLTSYLRAWCTIETGNLDGGLDQLVKLTSTVVPKLADAVRLDIVSVLAADDANAAERRLAKHKLSNLDRLDLLAAVFVELGKRGDAYAINTLALEADRNANHASSCRRLARELALGPRDARDVPLEELRALAQAEEPDPLCVELYAELSCWSYLTRDASRGFSLVQARCGPYWSTLQVTPNEKTLVAIYTEWPAGPMFFDRWYELAERIAQALDVEGADALATTALEGAVQSLRCNGTGFRDTRLVAQRILFEPSRKKTVEDARLRRLIDAPATLCAP